jgi:transmembrane sensor
MSIPEFKELLHKYNTGTCTEEEKALIETWYTGFELKDTTPLTDEQVAEILALRPAIATERTLRPGTKWIAAAAAILVFILAGVYLAGRKQAVQQVAKVQTDVLPGSNKAVLTLFNGKKIVLTSAQKGKLAYQGNTIINKTADDKLVYASQGNSTSAAMVYNTLTTPRGGQYHLVLADGTNVLLNAASSIKYPAQFTGSERKVEITGEVYFEVVHDKNKPFRVVAGEQTVEDLGTKFDIDAYGDEPIIKTTLLEGSIQVSRAGGTSAVLKPGEASVLTSDRLKITNGDTEEAIAWKNGDFIFKNQNLQAIMKNVARWYDIDVKYGELKNRNLTYSGEVSRSKNLSAVLQMLESTGQVKFKIEGNNVRVSN